MQEYAPNADTGRDSELAEQNRKGLLRLCLVFTGVCALNMLFSLFSKELAEASESLYLTLGSAALWLLVRRLTEKHPSHEYVLGTFYAVASVMLLSGIWYGSFRGADLPAFIFPLYLLMLPLFLVDRPNRQIGFAAGMTVVFLICSFFAKSRALFLSDLRHMLIVLFVDAVSFSMMLRARAETMDQTQELKDSTFRDALTGLLNKRGVERVCSMLENGVEGTLILLDLDHFKEVNDSFGHAVGDMVLNHVAFAMRRSFRSSDLLLRFGGDEFAVYAVGLIDPDSVRDKLAQLRAAVADDARGCPHVTCSLGAAVWHRTETLHVQDVYAELFRRADAALYQAKESGRNCWRIAD